MSKQLAISAVLSVFAMAAVALLETSAHNAPDGQAMRGARVEASAPALGGFAPVLTGDAR